MASIVSEEMINMLIEFHTMVRDKQVTTLSFSILFPPIVYPNSTDLVAEDLDIKDFSVTDLCLPLNPSPFQIRDVACI